MSDRARLIPLVDRLSGVRVLVVGDAMLDRFVSGRVDRISPEAPIPVLRVQSETVMPGGAGNVIRNLAALGAKATFVGVTGDDSPADELSGAVGSLKDVDVRLVRDPSRPTTIKTRYVSGTQQLMRADWEAQTLLSDEIANAVMAGVEAALPDCDIIILSDYAKGVLADGRAAAIIDKAHAASIPVIVDPKGSDFGVYRGADLITPNRKELEAAARSGTGADDAITDAANQLIEAHDLGGMLVTRSADGMTLVRKSSEPLHLPAETLEVYDVSGAGDTVVATMAAMIGAGADWGDAAAVANAAAGIVVGKVGTATAYISEVVAALHHQDVSDAEAKVLTLEQTLDRVARWRRQGLKVGFTNGCFDLLHPGHVSLLRQARAACDRLIVGLNSDASVKALKGDDRPVQNESARSTVLGSLADVDLVVLFGDDTPIELIRAIRPDVLIKGADYKVEDVVGGSDVQSWGGKIVLADLVAGQSTTRTISRMTGDA